MTSNANWLDLILDGVSVSQLERHAEQLIASGTDAGLAREQALQATQLTLLLQQRQQRGDTLNALNSIASKIAALSDPRTLFQAIVDQAMVLLGSDLAYLGLFEGTDLRVEVAGGAVSSTLPGAIAPGDVGLVGEIHRRAEPVWTHDYAIDQGFQHFEDGDRPMAAEGVRGVLGVPLHGADGVIGVLFAAVRRSHRFTKDEIQILVALAAHAAVAIDNAKANDQVRRMNLELRKRTGELERMLEWDTSLQQVVLCGGGVDEILAEASRIAERQVRFRPGCPKPGPHDRPVRADGQVLGYLTVEDDSCLSLLDRAATAVAMVLRAEQAALEATRHQRDGLVLGLITDQPTSRAELRQVATIAGLDLDARYVAVVAQPHDHDGEQARNLLERLSWPPGSVVIRRGTRVVALVCTDSAEKALELWRSGAKTVGTAGIGDAHPIADLWLSFREAQHTLSALLALDRVGDAARAEDLGIYRVLLSEGAESGLDQIIEQTLGPLLEVERKRNLHLLDTVEAYLHHLQRHSATAKALGIHPNTLYQRLEVIDRVLGADWRTPSRALDLQVLLKLRSAMIELACTPRGQPPSVLSTGRTDTTK